MVLHLLALNEGELGTGVLGHPRVADALRLGTACRDDVRVTHVELGPMPALGKQLARRVPWSAERGFDLQPSRWHAVQAVRAARVLRDAVAEHRPDAVHVHSHTIAFGASVDLPMVVSVDATVSQWQSLQAGVARSLAVGPSRVAERRLFDRVAAVQAWTTWAAEAARRACPTANVVELHPGIDLDAFRPGTRSGTGRMRVLFVGGDFERKGGPELLEAVAPLLGKEIELDVVTGATVQAPPGVRLHRLGPGSPELRDLLSRADVLCLPTRRDATPWVVLEAMASGAAVLATPVGAIEEVAGDAGVSVPVADVGALRRALVELAGDRDRVRDLGMRARARCEAHYDARRQAGALVSLVERCR